MAINYTTLFTRLGRFVAETNLWLARQGTELLNDNVGADDILDEYNEDRDLADGVLPLYLSMQGSMRAHIAGLNAQAQRTLASLQGELLAPNSSMQSILPLLAERMVEDSQTIKKNTISAPVATGVAGNVGNGGITASKVNASNSDDETCITELLRVRCVRDRFNGASAGGEAFEIVGLPKQVKEEGFLPRGSGGPTLTNGPVVGTLLTNGTLSSFTGDVPDGWTQISGTASEVIKNALQPHAYANVLELKSGGSSTVAIKQTIVGATAKRVMVANVWVKRSGGSWTGGGSIKFSIKGTGLSDRDVLSVDPAALTGTYANFTLFFATPSSIPDDYRVEITWTGVNLNLAKSIYLTGGALRPATLHGGSAFAVFRGSTDWLVGDEFTVVTANDGGGKFQTWFGRFFGVQLPSSASPTISDTLAS